MDRDLINQELARFGVSEERYISLFVSLLQKIPFSQASTERSMTFYMDREDIFTLEHPDRDKGTVEYEHLEYRDALRITESGEFLERMKKLAFGEKTYPRLKYC
jgi:hypothetical protein